MQFSVDDMLCVNVFMIDVLLLINFSRMTKLYYIIYKMHGMHNNRTARTEFVVEFILLCVCLQLLIRGVSSVQNFRIISSLIVLLYFAVLI